MITGASHDWRRFYLSQYDWLKGSHMTKVVWLPNETDYSYCEFVAPIPYSTQAAEKPPGHLHCTHSNTTSREAWLHCVSAPSAPLYHMKKNGGRGLGPT